MAATRRKTRRKSSPEVKRLQNRYFRVRTMAQMVSKRDFQPDEAYTVTSVSKLKRGIADIETAVADYPKLSKVALDREVKRLKKLETKSG
jgi:hypothetical protein